MSPDAATPIEIFRPGRHQTAAGELIAFGADEVAAIAASYDPALHEAPIVVGHPAHDQPAYGWVKGLAVDGDALSALPDQIDPEFADLVRQGRFKKISASFYKPDAPANPKPGSWYLRHVGFLGAQPPAVKGLKPVELGDDGEGVVELADDWLLGAALRSTAAALRGVREMLIADKGVEAADEVLPGWRIDDLNSLAAQIQDSERAAVPAFSEKEPTVTKKPTETPAGDKPAGNAPPADHAADKARLERMEQELKAQAEVFAERERRLQRRENETFVDDLVGKGILPPGHKPTALDLMEHLDGANAVEFADGDEQVQRSPLEHFKQFLSGLPKSIELAEIAGSDRRAPATINGRDPQAIARLAVAFQEEQKAKGIVVSTPEAVNHVMQEARA